MHRPTVSNRPLRAEVQGRDGDKLPAEGGDAPSRWLWVAKANVWVKRREQKPAKRLTGRPKKGSGFETVRQFPTV